MAVKVLRHESAEHTSNAAVAREAVIGTALSHPNIVRTNLSLLVPLLDFWGGICASP